MDRALSSPAIIRLSRRYSYKSRKREDKGEYEQKGRGKVINAREERESAKDGGGEGRGEEEHPGLRRVRRGRWAQYASMLTPLALPVVFFLPPGS